jgi:AcrR family transcriptional regulator
MISVGTMANRDDDEVPPGTPTPATARGTRTVGRILDAAAKLFGKEGYRGATMQGVAKAAGVSKGLLHYHFASKEHLLIEAQRATFRQVSRRIEERVRRGEAGMATAVEGLDAIWEAVREMRSWAPFMVETMALAAGGGPPPLRARIDEFYAEAEGLLEQAIRRVFAGDVDRLVVPPERLARLVRVNLHGLIVELAYARSPEDLVRIDVAYQDMRGVFEQIAIRRGPAGA